MPCAGESEKETEKTDGEKWRISGPHSPSKGHQEIRYESAQDKSSKTLQQTVADLLFVFQRVLVVIYY